MQYISKTNYNNYNNYNYYLFLKQITLYFQTIRPTTQQSNSKWICQLVKVHIFFIFYYFFIIINH